MAERLMKQGEQDRSTQIVSGYAVKKSPLEGLAKALTAGIGGYQERKADEMQTELDKNALKLWRKLFRLTVKTQQRLLKSLCKTLKCQARL